MSKSVGPAPTPPVAAPEMDGGAAHAAAAEGIACFGLDGSLRGVDAYFLELSGLAADGEALRAFDDLVRWLRERLPAAHPPGLLDATPAADAVLETEVEVGAQGRLSVRFHPSLGAGGVNGRIVSLHGGAEHRRLQRRMSQAQKMEAIGRLVGGISHDFNNLLTVIRGYCDFSREQLTALDAELLLSQKCHSAPLHKCLEEISKASRRASTLTRQLLAYSRQQVVAPEHLDLNAELREVEKMLDRLLGEQVQLELHPGVDPAMVFADRGQIHQMLMNLVINAHDAMPDGGTISLSTEAFT
ncbi:MAG: histidine kinase dimerization/phospho-acceptor domain-containing protein, partial [Acidobacteriota bacterium]